MTTPITGDLNFIVKAIEDEVRRRINKVIEEEVVNTKTRVEMRVQESIGQIVLSVLNHYTVERLSQEIVIRVKGEWKV